jgi:hypothetical protein
MNIERILPTVMIILSVMASIIYFYKGDIRHGVYWLAGATLTASVTF